jgi:hypothetical protein
VLGVDDKLRLERETGGDAAVELEDGLSDGSELVVLPRLLLATIVDVADCVGLEVEILEELELPGLADGTGLEAVARVLEIPDSGVEVMKTTVSGLVDCGELSDS